jgi:hypothetical protein
MGLELGTVFRKHTPLSQAENLKATAVRQERTVPADKSVQTAASRNELVAWTKKQMVGIAEDDFGAALDQVAMQRRLDRSLRADRHKRRCVHEPMRRLELAEAGRPVGGAQGKAKRLALSLVEGACQPVYY